MSPARPFRPGRAHPPSGSAHPLSSEHPPSRFGCRPLGPGVPHCRTVACAVPPHILERIARHGSEPQRGWALATLVRDSSHRTIRAHESLLRALDDGGEPGVPAEAPRPRRTVADAGGTETLPGVTMRSEGNGPVEDPAVNEAYTALGATFDFYSAVLGRDSIDDAGMSLVASVHYGDHYDNAFWDGGQMVFGDGDGQIFRRFTLSLDVIGHELTHGVTEHEASLAYVQQSGALNESISDVFGSLVRQYARSETAQQADWLIGQELLTDAVQGVALRSMKAPGTAYNDPVLGVDPQPRQMSDYVYTTLDNGGVHINSGIPNRAFYLTAVALGGHAWEKAGPIWYASLRAIRIQENVSFRLFAAVTARQAEELFGAEERRVVTEAWREVEVIP
ncbi:M4 family metallopeptidase [Frankia sp. R82]|uniref:M4 family metallopeptidase n=1 Tax=Frankia sp. R82 TaxID=2950553 RepID=UPI002042CC36|nr:M4 family metallopeptidase [Frankia sp. R82]MCM3882202.1 M4 family metallopeptidase [Frankia sp. R82]